MSHHISNNDPKQPCQCATPAVSKHNITPKDLEHGGCGCGCHPQDLNPSRLDQVIAQYEAMTKEAEAARDEFLQKANDLEDIAKETKATVNKDAIIEAVNNAQPDLSLVAKEARATLNKQEILAKFGKRFAVANGNVLTLYMVTLKQIEDLWIKTSEGDVRFSIATDQSNYYLSFSSDSPQAIAGQAIEDDAVSIYNDEIIFKTETITFPSGWTITDVILEGIDGNLLNENDAWRLAEIRRGMRHIDFTQVEEKLDAIRAAIPEECTSKDIDHMFETTTEDGQIIIPDGLLTPEGTMPVGVFKAITGLTPTE